MGEMSNSPGRTEDRESVSSAPGADPHQRVQDLVEQLKLRSAELEAANRELRRVSHYRSLFLARMSHELRTPLTSILGFSRDLARSGIAYGNAAPLLQENSRLRHATADKS